MSTNLEAGRELDTEIAIEVMGWLPTDERPADPENWTSYPDTWYTVPGRAEVENVTNVPRFSTDIVAAWPLAERFKLTLIPLLDGYYFAGRYDDDYLDTENGVIDGHFQRETFAVATTAPLAICLALSSAAKAGKL